MNQLNIDYMNLILILSVVIIFLFLGKLYMKSIMEKFIFYITITLGTFFSGIGIIVSNVDNTRYLAPFILFIIVLLTSVILVIKSKSEKPSQISEDIFVRWKGLFFVLGIMAIIVQLSKLVYPEFKLFNLFQINNYYFASDTFQVRLAQRSDSIYSLIDLLSSLMIPYFFILLYILRKRPVVFILLTLFYPYISFVQTGYISRNIIIMWLIIILFYLYSERIVKKRVMLVLTLGLLVFLIPVLNSLYYHRIGDVTKDQSISKIIVDFLSQESFSQQYLYICEAFSGQLNIFMMVLRSVLKLIPFLPGIEFPVLSYSFSEAILGLKYGASDYYILLPGAFGEGIMVLGVWWAWIYALFISIFCGLCFNLMKKVSCLKYWMIFFILNYGLSFRGGFQTFFNQFFYSMVFLFILFRILEVLTIRRTLPRSSLSNLSDFKKYS